MGSLLTRTVFPGWPAAPPGLGSFHVRTRDTSSLYLTETVHPPGYRIPVHIHRMVSFYLLLSGGASEQTGPERTERVAGELVFSPAGQEHSDVIHGCGAHCLIVELQPQILERVLECGRLPRTSVSFRGHVAHLASKLYAEFRFSDSLSSLILEGLALEMLAEACRSGSGQHDSCSMLRVERAREFLDKHYAEAVSLAQIAQRAGFHPVYLARMFLQRYACSVGEYVRSRRVEAARRQLSAGTKSLAQIASQPQVSRSTDESGTVGVGLAQLYSDQQPNHRGPLVVLGVVEGLPAAKAGLERGDLVVAVNGQSVLGRSLADITAKDIQAPVGSTGAKNLGLPIALRTLQPIVCPRLTYSLTSRGTGSERRPSPLDRRQKALIAWATHFF